MSDNHKDHDKEPHKSLRNILKSVVLLLHFCIKLLTHKRQNYMIIRLYKNTVTVFDKLDMGNISNLVFIVYLNNGLI